MAALGVAACDPYVKVTGVVRNTSGAPLGDVVVTLQTTGREPDTSRTSGDGEYDVAMVGADPKKTLISFHKDGFQALEQVVGEEERRVLDVTLLPN